jgi:hypothetical protein
MSPTRRITQLGLAVICLLLFGGSLVFYRFRLDPAAPVFWAPLAVPTRLDPNATVVLLWWTKIFRQPASDALWRPPHEERRPACPKFCEVTTDRSRLYEAQMIMFHSSELSLDDLPPRDATGRHQSWVYASMESPLHDEVQVRQPDSMRLFDYISSYRRDSDFPATYEPIEDMAQEVVKPLRVPIEEKDAEAPVAWIGSNCLRTTNPREAYLEALFRHVKAHSYGKCLHNKDWPTKAALQAENRHLVDGKALAAEDDSKISQKHYRSDLLQVVSRYKFYLAVENSNCLDYVTEKLFNALLAGVVPIVNGPRQMYEPFLPLPDAALFLDEYPHPADLAARLNYLHHNDTAYAEMLRYKPGLGYHPPAELSEAFATRNRVAMARYGVVCQMCIRAHEEFAAQVAFQRRGRVIPPEGVPRSGYSPLRGSSMQPDTSCQSFAR